jgi:hypothetical protein
MRIAFGAPLATCPSGAHDVSIAGLVTAVRNALFACAGAYDFSDFVRFTYAQQPALGFCPRIGSLLTASIRRYGDTYALSTRRLAAGTPGVDACLPDFIDFEGGETCAVALPESCRLLSDEEVAAVQRAFAAVRIENGPPFICRDVSVDPCVIRSAEWDRTRATDYPCSEDRRIEANEVARLEKLLASLATPETGCTLM